MRIHITGNAGSGKTTLARNLSLILGIEVFGLDKVVWKSGWEMATLAERRKIEEELVSQPQWIIEGVSSLVRQTADINVFLDIPRNICYLRCLKRNWRYLFSSRPGLPDKCPEILIVPKLVKIIWQFPSLVRPIIVNDQVTNGKTSITLKDNKEVIEFLNEIQHNKFRQATF